MWTDQEWKTESCKQTKNIEDITIIRSSFLIRGPKFSEFSRFAKHSNSCTLPIDFYLPKGIDSFIVTRIFIFQTSECI